MNVRIFFFVLFHRTKKQSGLTTVPTSLILFKREDKWDVSLAAAALFDGTSARGRIPEGGRYTLDTCEQKPNASSLQPSNEQLFCIPAGL